MRIRRALVLVPLLLAGCGQGEEQQPVEPEPVTRTLAGVEDAEWRAADAAESRPVDLDRAIVQAHCQRDDGWKIYPGSGAADGTFTIAGLPTGPCFVRVDHFVNPELGVPANDYFRTDADDLDLGTFEIGRTDLAFATQPTSLEVQATGLAAWDPATDQLGIYAPNARLVNYNDQDIEGAVQGFPAAGGEALALRYDWAGMILPLVEEAKGDTVTLTQWRVRENEQGVRYLAPLRSLELPPLTVADGATTQVSGAFEEPPVLEYHLNWARSKFEELAPQIHAKAGAGSSGFVLRTSPATGELWSPREFGTELLLVDTRGEGDVDLGTFAVPNPFPNDTLYDWYEVMFPVAVEWLPGAEAELDTRIGVYNSRFPTADAPAVPLISPVRNLRIEGQAATEALESVGLQPTITWDPPELGTATSYEIRIMEPGFGDMSFGGNFTASATLYVDGSVHELQLPPDLLADWGSYHVLIRAISAPGVDVNRTPHHLALPYAYADALSETFTP